MLPRIKKVGFRHTHIDDELYTDHDIFLHAKGHERIDASHVLGMEDFDRMLLHEPELAILGTGFKEKVKIHPSVLDAAKKHKIELVVMPTQEAVRHFQEHARKGKKVVAKLHITC